MRASRAVPEPLSPGFAPVLISQVELSKPLEGLSVPESRSGVSYREAHLLVRLHDEPLGVVEIDLRRPESVGPEELAALVERDLGRAIAGHMDGDGIAAAGRLTAAGLRSVRRPACLQERDAFLADPPPLTVLIPSRERADRLRRCIESILMCDYPPERLSVLVVDNRPETDGTRRLVEEEYGGRVLYEREDASGSASARNRGLEAVKTDIVLMTDDDVLVDRHWPTEVARAFAAHPDAACVSGLLLPAEIESPAQLWFEQYGGFSRGFDRRVFDLGEHRPPPAEEPVYPWTAGIFGTGNNFSFRTAALKAIGGFDPALGNGTPALGGVDSEVLLRTVLTGHKIVYEPRALVHHAHRPDYQALRRQVYAYGVGLVAYYLKTLSDNPRLVGDFLARVPAGVRLMFAADSHVNVHKQSDYPKELTWLERRGMLYGPLAYTRSRRVYGRHRVAKALRPGNRR